MFTVWLLVLDNLLYIISIVKESEKCVGANNTEDEPENLKINFDDAKILPALGYTWSHFVNIRIGLQYVDDNEREVFKILFV